MLEAHPEPKLNLALRPAAIAVDRSFYPTQSGIRDLPGCGNESRNCMPRQAKVGMVCDIEELAAEQSAAEEARVRPFRAFVVVGNH
jgi:hypothetical protein